MIKSKGSVEMKKEMENRNINLESEIRRERPNN
jgi:hypothetical protein